MVNCVRAIHINKYLILSFLLIVITLAMVQEFTLSRVLAWVDFPLRYESTLVWARLPLKTRSSSFFIIVALRIPCSHCASSNAQSSRPRQSCRVVFGYWELPSHKIHTRIGKCVPAKRQQSPWAFEGLTFKGSLTSLYVMQMLTCYFFWGILK
jgi:hypothetical protein